MKTGLFRRLTWTLAIVFAYGAMGCAQTKNEAAAKPSDTPPSNAAQKPASQDQYTLIVGPNPVPQETKVTSDVTGSWKWTVDAQGTQINHSAKFKQSGQAITGTWTDTFGDQTVTADIKEGSIKDGKVSFKVTRSSPFGDGSEMTLNFSGALATSKDKIDGTINVNIPGADPIPNEWHAVRVKE